LWFISLFQSRRTIVIRTLPRVCCCVVVTQSDALEASFEISVAFVLMEVAGCFAQNKIL